VPFTFEKRGIKKSREFSRLLYPLFTDACKELAGGRLDVLRAKPHQWVFIHLTDKPTTVLEEEIGHKLLSKKKTKAAKLMPLYDTPFS
jgi:hypothetical protein